MYTDKNYKVCSLHINIPLKFGYLYIQKIKHCAIHVLWFELLWRMLLSCGCVKRRGGDATVRDQRDGAAPAAGKIDENSYLF